MHPGRSAVEGNDDAPGTRYLRTVESPKGVDETTAGVG